MTDITESGRKPTSPEAPGADPLLVVVLVVWRDRRLMGEYVNGRLANILVWLTFVLMTAGSMALFLCAGISL